MLQESVITSCQALTANMGAVTTVQRTGSWSERPFPRTLSRHFPECTVRLCFPMQGTAFPRAKRHSFCVLSNPTHSSSLHPFLELIRCPGLDCKALSLQQNTQLPQLYSWMPSWAWEHSELLCERIWPIHAGKLREQTGVKAAEELGYTSFFFFFFPTAEV